MRVDFLSQAGKLLKERKQYKRQLAMFLCLALIVTLGTVAALKLYGQAMTHKVDVLDCSFEVHKHTEECYEKDENGNPGTELICGYADYVVHAHNDGCYDTKGELACTLEEHKAHTHTDECYVTELVKVCGKESAEEQEGMTDGAGTDNTTEEGTTDGDVTNSTTEEGNAPADGTENANTEDGAGNTNTEEGTEPGQEENICGLEEHEHDENCYENRTVCGYAEEHVHEDSCISHTLECAIAEHEHTDACYNEEGEIICEAEEHEHIIGCYDELGNLICKIEIHAHDESCQDGEGNFVCGMEEHEEHIAGCYRNAYACGMEAHTHEEACYESVLTCETEEHEHTDACWAQKEEVKAEDDSAEPEEVTEPEENAEPEEGAETGEPVDSAQAENETEAHVHTDACYEKVTRLACGELELHTHDNSCYAEECFDEDGNLIEGSLVSCGLLQLEEHMHTTDCYKVVELTADEIAALNAGATLHIHTDDCYGEEGILICGHDATHLHVLECYDDAGKLICGYGAASHVHDENCLDEVGNRVCGYETEEHVHEDSCYDEDDNLICGYEAGIVEEDPDLGTYCGFVNHAHEDDCYDEEGNLTCESEEHVHVPECYDPVFDHTHTIECYDEDDNLVCGEEGYDGEVYCDAEHMHGRACYIKPVYCGREEHTHLEDCYEENGELTCEMEEHVHTEDCYVKPVYCGKEEHTHTDACLDESGDIVCGVDEHVHRGGCFNTENQWKCGLPEHVHEDSCFDEDGILICGLEEHTHTDQCTKTLYCDMEEHAHSEECYDEDGELICGYEEHVHTEDCYKQLYCGKEEHTHTEECYDEDGNLICEIEEHEHTEECYKKVIKIFEATDDGVKVIAKVLKGVLPDDAELFVKVLSEEGETVEQYEKALAAIKEDNEEAGFLLALDITFRDADGNELEPDEHFVEVSIMMESGVLPEEADLSNLIVGHLKEGIEGTEVEVVAAAEDGTVETDESTVTAQFEVDSFSIYFVTEASKVYAVDSPLRLYWKNLTTVTTKSGLYALGKGTASSFSNFTNFVAIVVEDWGNSSANYNKLNEATTYHYVKRVIPKGTPKDFISSTNTSSNCYISTGRGYVIFLTQADYNTLTKNRSIVAGDKVILSHGYDGVSSSLGSTTINFSHIEPSERASRNNTSKLQTVTAADTSELINVDLYDYGNSINTKYTSDKKYPGFQNPRGAITPGWLTDNTLSGDDIGQNAMAFGDNITSDMIAGLGNSRTGTNSKGNATWDGKRPVVVNEQSINGLVNQAREYKNGNWVTLASADYSDFPVSTYFSYGAIMNTQLINGYPALADGTSLAYLFSKDDSSSVRKANTANINGLFQYNSETGAYTFNSRENHAQFNAESNTFTLYEQILSPNYIMYPFGNFLPFNDITSAMQSSQINRTYFVSVAETALKRFREFSATDQAKNGYTSEAEAYLRLYCGMDSFVRKMDAEYGVNGWNGDTAIVKYFKESGVPDLPASFFGLENVYTIDYDTPTDFYFGMAIDLTFMQGKGGKSGLDGNQDMVFYFTGDDDVWVYVDNKLFLDLSGIHRHVGGEIDFVKGEVRYYALDVASGDVSTTAYKTVKFSELVADKNSLVKNSNGTYGTFKDYSVHDLKFYYMERGSGSGVCRFNFILPILKKNSITVGKEVSKDNQANNWLGNPDYKFQILKANGSTKTQDLFIPAGTAYEIYDDFGLMNKVGTGTVGENGIFTLKGGQYAVFTGISEDAGSYYVRELLEADIYEQYGKIEVYGSQINVNQNVEVGSAKFVGVESGITNANTASAMKFTFNNQVTTTKTGSLQITKEVEDGSETADVQTGSTRDFEFKVTLDGTELPVGTSYTVVGKDNKTESKKVEKTGIVTLKAGETATISGILAGSIYTVQETAASADGYTVSYTAAPEGNGNMVSDDTANGSAYIRGMILPSTKAGVQVKVTVTNSTNATSFEIPFVKTLKNFDRENHTYVFEMVECLYNETTKTFEAKPDSAPHIAKVSFEAADWKAGEDAVKKGLFPPVVYVTSDLKEGENIFYYKITEKTVDAASTTGNEAEGNVSDGVDSGKTKYDTSVYIVKVKVSRTGGTITEEPQIAGIYKWNSNSEDGKLAIADATELNESEQEVRFKNEQLHDLTIQKLLIGGLGAGDTFTFKVTVKEGESPVNGEYAYTVSDETDETPHSVVFSNGEATVSLKANQYLTIHGLPYGITWKVEEIITEGYKVFHNVGNQNNRPDSVSDELMGSSTNSQSTPDYSLGEVDRVTFINEAMYALPETGGAGSVIYTIAGVIILLLGAGFMYRKNFREGRDEREISS